MGKAHRSGKESADSLAVVVALIWRLPVRRELKARAKRPVNSAGTAAEANLSVWFWSSSCRVLGRFGGCWL